MVEKSVVTVLNPSPDDTPSVGGIDEIGDRIVYQVTVENTGSVDLDNVVVTDTSLASPVNLVLVSGDNGDNILQPTETWVYQGEYAFSQADADANKVDSVCLDDVEAMLPTSVDLRLTPDGSIYSTAMGLDDSYFDGKFTNGSNSFLDGWGNVFCLNSFIPIRTRSLYTNVQVSSSYDALPSSIERPENMDMVNWIINQDLVGTASAGGFGNFTGDDIQIAIWTLIESGPPKLVDVHNFNQDRIDEIVAAATLAVGIDDPTNGYTPGCGDQLVVILDPGVVNGVQQQPLMTSVEIPCSGTLPNTADVSATVAGTAMPVAGQSSTSIDFSVAEAGQPAVSFDGVKSEYRIPCSRFTPTFAFLNDDLVVGGTGDDSYESDANGNDTLQGGDGDRYPYRWRW